MKKFSAIITIFVFALFSADSFAANATGSATANKNAAPPTSASNGKVAAITGNVFIARGANAAHQAAKDEVVTSGTAISTGPKSFVVLKFEDGQVVTMQANSTFVVREYRYEPKHIENSRIVFSMLKGGLRFLTGLIGQNNKQAFRLATPNATIGIRGTEFMVAMANSSMYSQVLAGNIGMTNAAGTVALGAGQTAYVASANALATLIPTSAIPPGTFSQLLSTPATTAPAARPASSTPPASQPSPPSAVSTPAPPPAAKPTSPAATMHSASPVTATTSTIAAAGGAATTAGIAGGAVATGGASGASSVGSAAVGVGGAVVGVLSGAAASSSPEQTPSVTGANTTGEALTAQKMISKEAKPNPKEESIAEAEEGNKTGVGVTGKIGTLGFGAELNYGISDSFSTRVGLNSFSYSHNANSSQINYDFKMKLQSVSALADWYPFTGGFRTTVGLLYDNNKISLSGQPTAGTFTINGTQYTTTDVGSLQASMSFNKVAPYFGIGWGNPVAKDKGWGLVTDIGILFQGKPKIDLTVTCINPTICSQLQADATAENTKLQNDLSNFKFWPVASIGISYQW